MDDYRSTLERELERLSPPRVPIDQLRRRRDRKDRDRRIRAGVLGLAIANAVTWWGIDPLRSTHVPAVPPDPPAADLGIFAPVAGGIVYGDGYGIWGVDPTAPAEQASPVQLTSDRATPLGWSGDGTELLIMQTIRRGSRLSVLQADGSEVQVAEQPPGGSLFSATISPDGSRVVFATDKLYSVDVEGGPAEVLLERGEGGVYAPTFSPDGARIAYVVGSGDHGHHVWVMNADGSEAHEIVFNETTAAAGHVLGLAWSPAGDRIALGLDLGIFTFAPDGSAFTQVISVSDGTSTPPYWSPDGSQIAYTIQPYTEHAGLAIADADGSNDRAFNFGAAGPWHPGQSTSTEPTPADPTVPPQEPNADLGIFADVRGWIAYGDASGIWAVDPAQPGDPAGQIQLSSERGEPLAWSPDGSKLLVLREVPGTGHSNADDLYALNPDGTWDRLTHVNGYITGASFSPEGTEIVYAVWETSGTQIRRTAIYVGDVESGSPRLVTDELGFPYEPAFSPDGSQIAYFDGSGDHGNSLRLMNEDGSDVRELTGADYGHIDELVWSPDGSRLAFSLQGGGLFIVGVDGSGLVELIPDGEHAAWSPDGSRISFQRRAGTPVQEVRNGEQVEVTYCPCGLGRLEIVTLDGGHIQEFGYAGSGPWNPLDR
jgi:Tol biopolymer transport system component